MHNMHEYIYMFDDYQNCSDYIKKIHNIYEQP